MDNDSLRYVQEYITKMNTQDNRCTATPFYYQIRDYEWVSSYHDGEGDRCNIVYDTEQHVGKNLVEAFESFVDSGWDLTDFEGDTDDEWDIQNYLDGLENLNGVFWEIKKEVLKGVFFTETDAENHLKENAHHYSSEAYTYVNHAWRAPELKKFFQCVGDICGVKFQRK